MRLNLSSVLILTCTGFGVVAFISPAVGLGKFRSGISLALEFWMAAGLIRLSEVATWQAIATAAVFIIIRKVTNFSLARQKF